LPNSIQLGGRVFVDHNGDGVQESGDAGLAGVKIYIDQNHNGVLDAAEPRTTTNANGDYLFTTLGAHSFRVREVLPVGYQLARPSSGYYDVVLVKGEQLLGKNFADQPQAIPNPAPMQDPFIATIEDERLRLARALWT
jgi:hypothetical protein